MKKYIFIIIIAISLLVTSCGMDNPKDENISKPPKSEEVKGNEEVNDKDEGKNENLYYIDLKLTPEEAYDIFKEKYPNAKVKEVELDQEYGSYVYEIEGYEGDMEYEIKIDPYTGEIIKEEEESGNSTKGEIKREDLNQIPVLLKKAVEDIEEGYKLKDWEVEIEGDIIEFEIEFIKDDKKIEYKYNLRTGELIKVKEK